MSNKPQSTPEATAEVLEDTETLQKELPKELTMYAANGGSMSKVYVDIRGEEQILRFNKGVCHTKNPEEIAFLLDEWEKDKYRHGIKELGEKPVKDRYYFTAEEKDKYVSTDKSHFWYNGSLRTHEEMMEACKFAESKGFKFKSEIAIRQDRPRVGAGAISGG